ncbi:MAG: hypothetical protein L3J08_07780 [Flavobacteriaceae bacterium]|nr:hypothetical protein [Flavobacteriaceae bacterium]
MGKIKCKQVSHKEVIEKGNTNFDYIPVNLKDTMNKKDTLITKIREAFSNVKLENGIGLNEAQGIDDYEDAQTQKKLRAMDEKMNWENIPSSELERCHSSLSFFDPKGMRFHLPAFMIAELNNEFTFELIFCLINDIEYVKTQFVALSKKQKEAVKLYLEYIIEDEKGYYGDKNQIKSALDNYWSI